MRQRHKLGFTLLALSLAACSRRELPEHEKQRTERERAQAKRTPPRDAAARRDAAPDEELGWPAAVQEGYLRLYTAPTPLLPQAAQMLAHLGQPAAPALRRLAASEMLAPRKRAIASFMLVDLAMFRTEELGRLAREAALPFVQRAALQALARLGTRRSEALLGSLATELASPAGPQATSRPSADHASPRALEEELPTLPLLEFIARTRRETPKWRLSELQLAALDKLLQASTPEERSLALQPIADLSYEDGLLALIRSPVTRPPVLAAALARMVDLAARKPGKLRQLLNPSYPGLLRGTAARVLLEKGNARDRTFLKRLADDAADPLSAQLKQLLSAPQPPPRR